MLIPPQNPAKTRKEMENRCKLLHTSGSSTKCLAQLSKTETQYPGLVHFVPLLLIY